MLYLQVSDGNESDQAVFATLMKNFREKWDCDAIFVADAALYSVDNIESLANLRWVSRVPATIKDTSHNFIFVKGLTKTQLINPNTFVHCNLKKMLLRMSYIKINYKKF